MQSLDHTFAVILAGGGGSRLWPKSRKKTPKQFLKLTDTKTMMQATAERITKLIPWERVIVVTNEIYTKDVKEQLPQLPTENIISEPEKKDTALAMLTGSIYAQNQDPEAVVINLSSDHVVTNTTEFLAVMKVAAKEAAKGESLVTVGITPTYPSSGFGYIKIGKELQSESKRIPLFKVNSFTEKPNVATARAFITTGKYFWNANNYVWKASTVITSFKEHMPSLYKKTEPLHGVSTAEFHKLLPKVYKDAEAISVDYAISEKASNLVLVPGDFGWNDIGDWRVVHQLSKKDLSGNVILSDDSSDTKHALSIESKNNMIHVGDRLVALVGVDDMIVIDTDEIVMIAPMEKSQDVKKLVERLKEEGAKQYL